MTDENTFVMLLKVADRYCKPIGINKSLLIDLFNEKSDWAFILQIDALHETACRELFTRLLRLNGLQRPHDDGLDKFIYKLSYQGQASIMSLLKSAGVPKDHVDFVEAVRTLRNSYAHNIRSIKKPLLQSISERDDKSRLLKLFSYIEPANYNEVMFLDTIKQDTSFLRFLILHQCMVFLALIHVNFGKRRKPSKKLPAAA